MKKLIFILFSMIMAQEMEVDGGLTVTEGVTASSFVGNGGGLTGIGIKPERIYNYQCFNINCDDFYFTVPDGKVWRVIVNGKTQNAGVVGVRINVQYQETWLYNGSELWLFQNQYFSGNEENYSRGFYTIFEYAISGSGTDQGMDYIEP